MIAGLSMGPVARLKKTWRALSEKHEISFNELSVAVSARYQYASYRKILKNLELPALPFLGVYLTDLAFLELGNQDYLPGTNYINFEKRRKVYRLVQEVKRYQSRPYSFASIPEIQEFIKELSQFNGPVEWEKKFSVMKTDLYEKSFEHESNRMEEADTIDD